MTDSDFRALVRRMRKAQRQYFSRRDNLDECKALERAVDGEAVEQPSLFGRADGEPSAPSGEDVRALVIEMRRYVLAHGVLLGECVAWDRLKKLAGVGQDENCPSEN